MGVFNIFKNKKVLLICMIIMILTFTACGKDTKIEGNGDIKDGNFKVEEYYTIAHEINEQLYTDNAQITLKRYLESKRDVMTDNVYNTYFDMEIPFIFSSYIDSELEKQSYIVKETIGIPRATEDGNEFDVYIMFTYEYIVGASTPDSDLGIIEMKGVTKYTFKDGKIIDYKIVF